jgi:hypothetical protein
MPWYAWSWLWPCRESRVLMEWMRLDGRRECCWQRVSVCIGEGTGAADRAAVRVAGVADGDGKGCPDVGVRVLWMTSRVSFEGDEG